ncbi:trypsin-like peptidase domain-containing protein [Sulfurimonas sp. MAG313]|nr:S1C family serine protease [Sulfurimonas sp. MAG313]MDF1881311.1 trypsin-like peptidase domain-containing protein [Sulfurimonas sp. MAG313]
MKFILLFLPIFLFSQPFHDSKKIKTLSSSVVKLFNVSVKPNYYQPWQMRAQKFSTGSGVIIKDKFILTAAHVVSNSVYLEAKKSSNPKKFIAQVKWISHDADLALLEIEDETFFEGTQAIDLGTLPHRQDGVAVYGYPQGGNEISITQGIISRIEHTVYVHSDFDLLSLQIDAAINPGNSGGPVFDVDGNIIGIAMQALSSADNIGYLVPTPIIKHFLNDIKDGKYDGFPDDGLYIQGMENKTIKSHYNMQDKTGVLITHIVPQSSSDGYLKKDDVLLKIDGETLSDDATILMKENGRVAANYLIRSHHIGEKFEVTVLRKGKELSLEILSKPLVALIPFEHDKLPKYYIFGGVVFMPLTKNYLFEWGRNWVQKAPIHFVDIVKNSNFPSTKQKEIVFVQSILADRENAGYEMSQSIVQKVNSKKIDSFSNFVKAIRNSKEKNIIVSLEGGQKIILNQEKSAQANKRLLKRYGIKNEFYLQ